MVYGTICSLYNFSMKMRHKCFAQWLKNQIEIRLQNDLPTSFVPPILPEFLLSLPLTIEVSQPLSLRLGDEMEFLWRGNLLMD